VFGVATFPFAQGISPTPWQVVAIAMGVWETFSLPEEQARAKAKVFLRPIEGRLHAWTCPGLALV
jgi:hypothetical protein